MIYLFVVFFLLLLVYYYDYKGYKRNRDLWYKVILIVFILIAGLRYRLGIDTPSYLYDYYHETPTLYNLKFTDLNIGNYPLWRIINSFFYTIGAKFYVVQLVESAFVNILVFRYIKKHGVCIFTCILLFFVWMYASYNMEAMKAGFSMALCLFANDFFLDKKWIKFVLISFLAFLFHPSSIIITLMTFMTFLKLNLMGLIILCITFFVGSMISIIYGDLIEAFVFNDYIYNKAVTYGDSDTYFVVEGRNINYYLAHYVFIIIPSLIAFWVVKNNATQSSLMKFEPYLFLSLFFVTMSVNILLFFRIYYFYVIYIILFISQSIIELLKRHMMSFSLIKLAFILFPFLMFVYVSYQGDRWKRYYPYASVIDKTVNKKREKVYSDTRTSVYSLPSNRGEY